MTKKPKHQPEGQPNGGQFAPDLHSEPGVTLGAAGATATASAIIAAGTYPVTLRYAAYDDSFTTKQMDMILEGNWNDAENDVDENLSDGAYEESVTVARGDLETAVAEGRFDREWDELDPDEQDAARYAVEERDDSDPVKDLLRSTGDQLMRTSLGSPAGRLSEPRWASGHQLDEGGFEARQKALSDLLKEAGVDPSAEGVQDALAELVDNGPFDWHDGVQLDVIFYAPLEDAVPCTRFETDPGAGREKVLEFAKPNILLIDKWNGSGHDVVIPSPLKKTLTRPSEDTPEVPQTGRAYLDASGGGYSWDAVCGLVKSAYGKDGTPKASWG